jgi:hypothetical protein
MRHHHRIFHLLTAAVLTLALSGALAAAQEKTQDPGPKRGRGVSTGAATPSEPIGPKRGRGVVTKEEPAVVTRTEIVTIEAKPNKGYLSLVAVPGAQVTLTALGAGPRSKSSKPIKGQIDEEGTFNLVNMSPGKYRVEVGHDDFRPYSEVVEVAPAKLTSVNASAKLISKYGEIVIGGAPAGSSVLLDQQAPDGAQVKIDDQGSITISRVAVGEHRLTISKAGYDDWSVEKLEVRPGQPVPVTANLALSTVTLVVRAKPGAEVYLDGEKKGTVLPDGTVTISRLLPVTYQMRVLLDGFENFEKSLALSLANRQMVEAIELVPIAESGEAIENFLTGVAKWAPTPTEWKVERGGIIVRGEAVVLFKDAAEKRPFNVYRDFTLDLDLRFTNGKGAAWIIRARDLKNYYLFELTTSRSNQRQKLLNFYICRDGKLELKDSRKVVEEVEKPNDTFHLTIEARGNQFSHKIRIGSAPRSEPEPLGAFTDDTFSYGGIGFQAINGIEMLMQSLVIIPEKQGKN